MKVLRRFLVALSFLSLPLHFPPPPSGTPRRAVCSDREGLSCALHKFKVLLIPAPVIPPPSAPPHKMLSHLTVVVVPPTQ